jgi:hypothetical protein
MTEQEFFYAYVYGTTMYEYNANAYGVEYYVRVLDVEQFAGARTRINDAGLTLYQVFSHKPVLCRKNKFARLRLSDGTVIYSYVTSTAHLSNFDDLRP